MAYMLVCLKNQKRLCFGQIITLILKRFEVSLNPKGSKGATTHSDCICVAILEKLNMDVVDGRWMYCLSGMLSTISLDHFVPEFIHDDTGAGNVQFGQNVEENEPTGAVAASNGNVQSTEALLSWQTDLLNSVSNVNKCLM
ncbi:hypothetical protein ACH5RR_009804 [Cinchona calisaya]|uniref:Uncharacterized protein n=1 Tax=Cinchona calisaya TaxID=153742 RepID=A0ABD3AHM0_9GENT